MAPSTHDPDDIALSVVIPAYNEERRIERTLERALGYLEGRRISWELIVVDDESADATAAMVRRRARADARVRLLQLDRNCGKGHAVRVGALRSRGGRVLFMDADLATPMEELPKLEAALDAGADIAIGSRALRRSEIEAPQDLPRELLGRLWRGLVRLGFGGEVRDTQCGFKLFTREAADALFSVARIDGFAFDVELLMLAAGRYRVAEVPVRWRHVGGSRVAVVSDGAGMLYDLARLKLGAAARAWRRRTARARD